MSYKQKLRHFINIVLGRDLLIRRQIKLEYEYLGSVYGGFAVAGGRLAGEDGIICYSVGIGEDISFDLEMIRKFNAVIYAFDPTPKSVEWAEKQEKPRNFHLYNYGLSDKDGRFKFYLPENPNFVSCSLVNNKSNDYILVDFKRLSSIMKEMGHEKINVLKMDIEGSEFDVIGDIIKSRANFEQLCLEIHQRFFENGKTLVRKMIKDLNDYGYRIFYVSDSGEELSFIKI